MVQIITYKMTVFHNVSLSFFILHLLCDHKAEFEQAWCTMDASLFVKAHS